MHFDYINCTASYTKLVLVCEGVCLLQALFGQSFSWVIWSMLSCPQPCPALEDARWSRLSAAICGQRIVCRKINICLRVPFSCTKPFCSGAIFLDKYDLRCSFIECSNILRKCDFFTRRYRCGATVLLRILKQWLAIFLPRFRNPFYFGHSFTFWVLKSSCFGGGGECQ